jgi:periplasmic protein TonB
MLAYRPSVQAAHLKMASITTSEFVRTASHVDAPPFSLIEQKGLIARLAEEFARASSELARDPRGFIRAIFADDAVDAKRRRKIRILLAYAVVAHVALVALIAFLGWHHLVQPKADTSDLRVDMVKFPQKPVDKPEDAPSEMPRGTKVGGGGGGGNHSLLPASKGVTPQMRSLPQVVRFNPPTSPNPTLAVQPTIVGPDSPPPPPDAPIGDPKGKGTEFSNGPGSGEGVGPGIGSGVGEGGGPGARKGEEGGPGNKGRPGAPNGGEGFSGPIPFNRFKEIPGSSGITWIRRPRPVTTAEAQANRVKGEVWMLATFRADGTISDIEVIREVPFMTESAIESLKQARFRPATVNGQPITLTRVPIRVNVTAGEN